MPERKSPTISSGPALRVRVSIVFPSLLDASAYAALLATVSDVVVDLVATRLDEALRAFRSQHFDLLILDTAGDSGTTHRQAETIVDGGEVEHVLLVDIDESLEYRPDRVHPNSIGHLSRRAGTEQLLLGIARLLGRDPSSMTYTQPTSGQAEEPTGTLSQEESSVLANLTPREREVMQLIAMGHSVRSVAELLKISHHTVDNHKSRLMAKLRVHKALDLTRLAIREGLIEP